MCRFSWQRLRYIIVLTVQEIWCKDHGEKNCWNGIDESFYAFHLFVSAAVEIEIDEAVYRWTQWICLRAGTLICDNEHSKPPIGSELSLGIIHSVASVVP